MRFTDRGIKALKPKLARYDAWQDGESAFGIRVFPSGIKSFFYMYRFQRRLRRMTLGVYRNHDGPVTESQDLISLADARVRLAAAKKKLTDGIDPSLEKAAKKKADWDAETVDDLITEYLDDPEQKKKRSYDYDKRILDVEIRPLWKSRKARDITRHDIIKLRDAIKGRGAPVMANRTLGVVSRLFDFAIDQDILQATPYVKIKKAAKETPRERNLSPDEIETFWNKLEGAKMIDQVRIALRLVLVTAQRRVEVSSARWDEIDATDKVWSIPGSRTKNKKAHAVPLSTAALSLLDDLRKLHRKEKIESEYLFPSPTRQGEPITAAALSRAMRNNLDIFGLVDNPCTVHDLRRSAATQMGRLKVTREHIGHVLNHSDGSVTAIYDQWEYLPEKRTALRKWGSELARIVEGKKSAGAKVVALR